MEMNKQDGKKAKQKAEESQQFSLGDNSQKESEPQPCDLFVGWERRSEPATQEREGATDLLSIFDKSL